MTMNQVIQEKRKELGFTQEQVAEYLNVSTPAVSKWEKGITSPDISILPKLARFLKMDLNTLFCFQEDMTMEEIQYFCQEAAKVVQTEGFDVGFQFAEAKLLEYPYNDTLWHYTTVQMDGYLLMTGMDDAAKEPYDAKIISWYKKLSKSEDDKISNSAKYMLAGRYIRMEKYEKAQEILDLMPDKEDILSSMADKLMLQVVIYQKNGEAERAVKELQYALLPAVQKVQMLLNKLVDAEIIAGNMDTAKVIAEKSSGMPALFDLWEYGSFVAPLQVSMTEEDAKTCVELMRNLLEQMTKQWDVKNSSLFYHIQGNSNSTQMLPALFSEIEKNAEYGFLRNSDSYQQLIAEYKEKL